MVVLAGQRREGRRARDAAEFHPAVEFPHLFGRGRHESKGRFAACAEPVQGVLVDVEELHARQHAAGCAIAHFCRREPVKPRPQVFDPPLQPVHVIPQRGKALVFAGPDLEEFAPVVEGEFVVLLTRPVDQEPMGLGQGVHGVLDRRGVADHAVRVFLHGTASPAQAGAKGNDMPSALGRIVEHGGEKAFLLGVAGRLNGRIDAEGPVHFGVAAEDRDSRAAVQFEVEIAHHDAGDAAVLPRVEDPLVVGNVPIEGVVDEDPGFHFGLLDGYRVMPRSLVCGDYVLWSTGITGSDLSRSAVGTDEK